MALVLKDRVRVTSSTTGTGTFTLGSAASGFQDFSVIGDGNTTYYTIQNSGDNTWEVGIGTYTASGTTLSRDTVLESSNSGSLVNFAAGTKDVFVTYPAEKGLYLDASNNAIGLGTPASATLTNATGLPISTGVSGLGSGVATFLGTPSSSNLASAVTDETGSGSLVFATSPTLVTPALGTPSSGTLTSCTGLPLTTGVTGTLPVTNGGTGTATSFTTGSVIFAGASGVYSQNNAGFFWDNTNSRLGIGTSAPANKLEISKNTTSNVSGGTNDALALVGADSTANVFRMTAYASNNQIFGFHALGTGASPLATSTNNNLLRMLGAGYNGTAFTTSRNEIRFAAAEAWTSTANGTYTSFYTTQKGTTTSTERMRIDDAGNVGIGTTSPSSFAKLAVTGVTSASNAFQMATTGNTSGLYMTPSDGGQFSLNSYGSGLTINSTTSTGVVTVGTQSTERMRIDSSGNVGIGTTSPNVKLQIKAGTSTFVNFAQENTNGGTDAKIVDWINNANTYSLRLVNDVYNAANTAYSVERSGYTISNHVWYTGSATERMRIHSSGGVSIGNTTDSGAASLNVSGSMSGGYIAHADGTTAMAFGADNVVRVTPNATATYTSTVPAAGAICVLSILTSGTTSYTITFGTGFKSTGTLATGTVSARYFNITFVSDGTNLIETSRTVAIA